MKLPFAGQSTSQRNLADDLADGVTAGRVSDPSLHGAPREPLRLAEGQAGSTSAWRWPRRWANRQDGGHLLLLHANEFGWYRTSDSRTNGG